MRKKVGIMFACLATCIFGASVEPETFLFSKVLEAPDSLACETGAFRIDSDIYRQTDDNFSDLRVFGTNGKEIPFVIRQVTAHDTDTVQYFVETKMENRVELPENRMALVFARNDNDSVPSELFIGAPLINFEKCVSVYGSNDKQKWHTLAEKQPIFDYTQYVDVRNTTVVFEKRKFAFYKVAVDNVREVKWSPFSRIVAESTEGTVKKHYKSFVQQQEPFRLENISFFSYVPKIRYGESQKDTYRLTIISSFEDTTKKLTEIILSSNREPLRKLMLAINGLNFSRFTTLEATNDTTNEPQWEQVARSEIYSIKAGTFSREKLEIVLNESCRYLKYRLRIFNKDNLPLEVKDVSAEGDIYEVLFFHHGQSDFRVFYGSDSVTAPQYDVESVLGKAPVIEKALWKVGGQVAHKADLKKEPLLRPKYILFGSLFLMVAVLAGVLFMAVGKVEDTTKGN